MSEQQAQFDDNIMNTTFEKQQVQKASSRESETLAREVESLKSHAQQKDKMCGLRRAEDSEESEETPPGPVWRSAVNTVRYVICAV